MNNVQTANLALSRVGHGSLNRITSLTEDSEAASIVNDVFQHELDVMLELYPWPFARVSVALATSPVTIPTGFGYAYVRPSNALAIHFVEYEGFNANWLALNDYRGQFEIYANPTVDGQIIVSQYASAWAWYTKQITEVAFTSPLFADALAWKLTGELALTLKADAKIAEFAATMYATAESIAAAHYMNQSGGMVRVSPETVAARSYGRDPAPWLPGHGRLP